MKYKNDLLKRAEQIIENYEVKQKEKQYLMSVQTFWLIRICLMISIGLGIYIIIQMI